MRSRISPLALAVLTFVAGLAAGQARGQAKPRMWADVVLDVYDWLGARIEDLVFVSEDGTMENLTPAPYELEIHPRG